MNETFCLEATYALSPHLDMCDVSHVYVAYITLFSVYLRCGSLPIKVLLLIVPGPSPHPRKFPPGGVEKGT